MSGTAAFRAEWTKLRTDPVNLWLLLGTVLVTLAVSAGASLTARCDGPGCGGDPTRLGLTGFMAGQVVAAVLGVLAAGNEYGTGMMHTTLAAIPRRGTVLRAKAAVLTAVLLPTGAAGALGSLLIGGAVQPGRGFTAAHGHQPLSLADGPVLRAAVGSVLYLALVGLLALGVAFVVRSSAAAVGIVLGLLFFLPVLGQVLADPDWQRLLQQVAPMPAGLAVQTTTDLARLPIGPWEGLGVLALWALAALASGRVLLRVRDA
ncbi:ABC transporter [Streptomyces spiroverticillatus]|uniref:ABC transporter n=1 Tax=Streptomyces finlayi TaxID=67296 RepID=A0A918WWS2_9ACTN|nr:ABC transporter permease [Streptomyces finlayi]GHA08188.1 ABC transporter [Streptomyces spiroverticillatus]GHC91247.1 ABC transporter [Streptomyces finlayi]